MRKPLTLTVLVVSALVALPAPATAAPPSSLYTLVFSDEFDGSTVDTSKWYHRTDVKGWSAQRPENVSVGGGLMTIHLRKEAFAGMQFTGGGLISKKTFRYGYYETRAKTSVGSGWHPAFWAMAGDGSTTDPANRRTEIDGFEYNMHAPRRIHHNVHGWHADDTKTTRGSAYDTGFDSSAAFHTYGFEWTESTVKFYVDGVLKYTGSYSPTCCTQHDYISAWLTSIAVNGDSSPGVDETKLPGQVQFDYFRYYQSGNYTDNDGPTAARYSETGAWTTSSVNGHTLENMSRYSAAAGATATWGGWLPAAGTYDVYIYKIVHANSDPNSRVDVTHNGGTATQFVDYTAGTTGWVKLGTWSFGQGFNGSVKLTGSGAGNARADAVRWVRIS
ncbi:MAG TPA: glycoside hydrolase family 16 protein [Candidatus Limnocylindrales bacterium]